MWIFGYGSLVWKTDFPYVKKVVGYVKGYERKFWQASIDHRGVPVKPGRVVTLVPSTHPDARVWGTAYKIHRRDVDFVVKHLDMREVMGYEKIPEEFHPIPNHHLNIIEIDSLTSSYSSNIGSGAFVRADLTSSSENQKPLSSNEQLNLPSIPNEENDDSGHSSAVSVNNEPEIIGNLTASRKSDHSSDLDSDTGDLDLEEDDGFDSSFEDVKIGRPIQVTMYFGSEANEHYIGPAPLNEMAAQILQCVGESGRNRDYLYNLAEAMRMICPEALDSHLSELERAVRNLEKSENARTEKNSVDTKTF